ncbi:ferredoxin [Nonomuraea sp. NPDC052129]|uniref:ferredoxin n=1 Tax=Nonomuraea sp. NPDC052129 TaxID=3154651 RepID=UPI00342CEDDD
MKVVIDQARCIGAGQCAIAAPKVFDQREDDGIVVLLDPTPGPGLRDAVHDAMLLCPAGVISDGGKP